jgi:hypothetical protein
VYGSTVGKTGHYSLLLCIALKYACHFCSYCLFCTRLAAAAVAFLWLRDAMLLACWLYI